MDSDPRPIASQLSAAAAAARIDWRMLLLLSGTALPIALVVALIAVGRLVPPVVVIALLYVVGTVLASRGNKAGPVVFAVPSVLLIVRNAPLLMATLAAPASTVDFLTHAVVVTLAATNLIAALATLRGRESSGGALLVAGVTVAVLAAVVVVAVVARTA